MRVFCIAQAGVKGPQGYIYKTLEDGTIHVARLVHLARYLPDLIPDDF